MGSIQQRDQQRQAEDQKRQELYGLSSGSGEGFKLNGSRGGLPGMSGSYDVGTSLPDGMSPDEYQARRQGVEDQVRLGVLGQEARDDSISNGPLIQTGGLARGAARGGVGSGGFEMVRNGNWDAALNMAADPFGILGDLSGLQQDLGRMKKAQIEGQLDDMRQQMRSAGVKDVPSGYQEAWDANGKITRDYKATVGQLNQVYENHLRDQRLRETWGDDYQNIRIGKSQMTVQEFEKRNLDIHMKATDRAYEQGVDAIARGQVVVKDGDYAKVLGNFVDKQVRAELRMFAKAEGINDSSASSIWAINRRLKSEIMPGYGIPDSRLGANVYADTTLARKNAYTPQIMKWNDIRPGNLLIIRPTQLGGAYAIPRISIPQQPKISGRGI